MKEDANTNIDDKSAAEQKNSARSRNSKKSNTTSKKITSKLAIKSGILQTNDENSINVNDAEKKSKKSNASSEELYENSNNVSDDKSGGEAEEQCEKGKNGRDPNNDTDELCKVLKQDDVNDRSNRALCKMCELLSCGDGRIELSAAKEILNLLGPPENVIEDGGVKLEVNIKIV